MPRGDGRNGSKICRGLFPKKKKQKYVCITGCFTLSPTEYEFVLLCWLFSIAGHYVLSTPEWLKLKEEIETFENSLIAVSDVSNTESSAPEHAWREKRPTLDEQVLQEVP